MRKEIKDIVNRYESYHPTPRTFIIESAYKLAEIVYFEEYRINNEPWINHSLRIAKYLAKLKLDAITISAALLHDSLTFGLSINEIAQDVHPEVADLVQNINNLKAIRGKGTKGKAGGNQEEYLRRLILSAGKDIRAVIIRLVEKLDSLSTVACLPEEKKQISLRNALDLYAPLAEQIGLSGLKSDLEDIAFSNIDPTNYKRLKNILDSHPVTSRVYIRGVSDLIKQLLSERNIGIVDYLGRKKRVYSFYNKILRYQKVFNISEQKAIEEVHDKVAFRVILETVEDCYKVLDVLHSNFKYSPENFDDYIAKPKPNGYKSLQTSLELLDGHFAEVQIRTAEMHEHNEFGLASHILYKLSNGKSNIPPEQKIDGLKRLLVWKQNVLTKEKLGVNIGEVEKSVFVFTPKGDLIELPTQSTVLDFAYMVHTDIGSKAARAKVNSKIKPLSYTPSNSDVIEIICDIRKKGPSRDQLKFVNTKEARMHIKKWLKAANNK